MSHSLLRFFCTRTLGKDRPSKKEQKNRFEFINLDDISPRVGYRYSQHYSLPHRKELPMHLRLSHQRLNGTKKVYESPALIELGNVSELTNTTQVSVQVSSLNKGTEDHYEV